MCYRSRSLPLAVPLSVVPLEGRSVSGLVYTLALAKATTLRNGEHYSTAGMRAFSYPLGRGWVRDPRFEPGSHTKCLHFSTPADAVDGMLDSYGSHRLIALPSRGLHWGGDGWKDRCWHDGAALPVCCLACDAGDDPSALNAPEFWEELRGRYEGDLRDNLFLGRAALPEVQTPRTPAPLPLEWIRQTQIEGSMGGQVPNSSGCLGQIVARWAIEGFDDELTAVVRKVRGGSLQGNEYSIQVHIGAHEAKAILCEDEEHGVYFYVSDLAFCLRLTEDHQPVALVTPVAAEVVEYLENVPGRWALPPRPLFPPVHHPRFS